MPQQRALSFPSGWLLFDAAARTLHGFAANPRWLGVTPVLHTWSQTLMHHPHVHGLVSGGALRASGEWQPAKPGFLLPVQAFSGVFRGKYLEALNALRADHQLRFPEDLAEPCQWNALINTPRRPAVRSNISHTLALYCAVVRSSWRWRCIPHCSARHSYSC